MIKVENIETYGWKSAIIGMRNPLNSWGKADSKFYYETDKQHSLVKTVDVGEHDLDLMKRLFKAGPEHRKYLRMIYISMDITAPLYWWKEADTYKVGTVRDSCSTMHKIASKEFTEDDFSMEHLIEEPENCMASISSVHRTMADLNTARDLYLKTKDKKYWWQMIQLLPSSYNQKSTFSMNYEVAYNMIKQRTGHKLDEWNEFVDILMNQLPLMKELIA